MLSPCLLRRAILTVPFVFVVALLVTEPVRADQEAGTAIPAESMYHPAVLCHSPYCNTVALKLGDGTAMMELVFNTVYHDSLLNALLGRPCVDCHAFEFMQRALQDLKKTAYNLDTRTETLLLQVEKRNLCDCVAANLLN
ncbi:Neuropeptide-like protein C4orf48 [Lonchura striata]|uniref:NELL2-interacting cell ontogeny regulator 1 n=1 Tax=Lonchura striata TaxID=40157 RepID=A0A218V8Z1_9PASE|nr:Neuropeptide-like protein C4orf48 [Lonchura striata domestica]